MEFWGVSEKIWIRRWSTTKPTANLEKSLKSESVLGFQISLWSYFRPESQIAFNCLFLTRVDDEAF